MIIAAGAALIALIITVALLERDVRFGNGSGGRDAQPHLRAARSFRRSLFCPACRSCSSLAGSMPAVAVIVFVHLMFVLPYVYLSLSDPWNHFDERYRKAALVLGADPHRAS